MRDLRAYARRSAWMYALGGFFLLFVVGDGLIWWIYGKGAAMMGLLCLAGGLIPVGLIFGAFALLDWSLKKINRDDG